jgi:hypothetical protein
MDKWRNRLGAGAVTAAGLLGGCDDKQPEAPLTKQQLIEAGARDDAKYANGDSLIAEIQTVISSSIPTLENEQERSLKLSNEELAAQLKANREGLSDDYFLRKLAALVALRSDLKPALLEYIATTRDRLQDTSAEHANAVRETLGKIYASGFERSEFMQNWDPLSAPMSRSAFSKAGRAMEIEFIQEKLPAADVEQLRLHVIDVLDGIESTINATPDRSAGSGQSR